VRAARRPPFGALTSFFFADGYVHKPRSRREQIEAQIRELKLQLWSSPEDRNELLGMIEAAEAELAALERQGGERRP
jgi:septal ring factor EnvC (AmiA/AmiB activator)